MGKRILRYLLEDIRNAQWFAVIANETSDVSNQVQFNVSVRWVGKNIVIREDPVGIVSGPDTTEETFLNVIKYVLIVLNLQIGNCRCQARWSW